jgi:hypothetical protein
VLETKQGVWTEPRERGFSAGAGTARKTKTGHGKRGTKGWDTAMLKARAQAQRYARALPKEEIADGRPPFIVVVDVGHSIASTPTGPAWAASTCPSPIPPATAYR